jgi:HD superfamily phosphohydrolase YqeK
LNEGHISLEMLIVNCKGAADENAALAGIMPRPRWEHSLGAATLAGELAVRFDYPEPARIYRAALWHDVGRLATSSSIPSVARSAGWAPDAEEIGNPELLHGPAGAAVAAAVGVGMMEAAAIRYHVTSRPCPPLADMIILAADAAEQSRRYPWAEGARRALVVSLELACAFWITLKIAHVLAAGGRVHPRAKAALAGYDSPVRAEAERLTKVYL